MAIDAARAEFVKNDFRYAEVSDTSVQTAFRGARSVEIDTNIATEAQAIAAANELLNTYKQFQMGFDVVLLGADTVTLGDFASSPPVFRADFPKFGTTGSGRDMLVREIEIDFQRQNTLVKLRG